MAITQRSFAGGEIAPALHARVDTVKYSIALKTMRNFVTMRHGGAASRAGGELVQEVKDSSKKVRLVDFVFNAEQTYVLEFGHLYMRVFRNGQPVMNGSVPFEIASPYTEAQVSEFTYAQSADVITIAHKLHPPMELKRTAHNAWTLTPENFSIAMQAPYFVQFLSAPSGNKSYRYQITAVSAENGEESLPTNGRPGATGIFGGADSGFAVYVVAPGHKFISNQVCYIEITFGSAAWKAKFDGKTPYLIEVDSTLPDYIYPKTMAGDYITNVAGAPTGGNIWSDQLQINKAGDPSVATPIRFGWSGGFGANKAAYYNIYKEQNGTFGYVGQSSIPDSIGSYYFNDTGAEVDISDNPPTPRAMFDSAGNYPSVVAYYQQRKFFANTLNAPEKITGSQTGRFKNFSVHAPLRDDDAVTYTMAGSQVNEVRHLLDLTQLVILTSGGEHAATAETLTPTSFNRKQYDYNGASKLKPIVIGGSALYVQALSSVVRDLGFEYNGLDSYRGNDLTIYSAHLVDGHTIVDWAYQKLPHSIVWSVREDGVLLGLTYVREQQMISWHRHDTDGFVENVCSVPEGSEYAVYIVVRRTINGVTKRYIERLSDRKISNIADYIGTDCTISYDGRNKNTALNLTLSGGVSWTSSETLSLTASASFFTAGHVGKQIHFTLADGSKVRFTIQAYTSGTVVTGKANMTVPASLRNAATSSWAVAIQTVTGLGALEGKKVSVLADGFVIANPLRSEMTPLTVSSGSITLPSSFYSVIRVGLPIVCDLETLDIDLPQVAMSGKGKLVNTVTTHVENSRSFWVGGARPAGADALKGLREVVLGEDLGPDKPRALATKKETVNIEGHWSEGGNIFIRHVDPLPLTVLAVTPDGLIPFPRGR